MSMFMPEGSNGAKQETGVSSITPSNPETTSDDIALMQRAFAAAARNPNLIPPDFMAYVIDYVQTSRLSIPIGQVFGYQRIAPQVIADFAEVPNPTDGQIVLLKVGTVSPFNYVQMMFDQKLGQWVSEEFSAGGGSGSIAAATSTAATPFAGKAGISWAPVHTGGLTMQLKWSGTLVSDSLTGFAGIHLLFGNLSSGTTTATMSEQSVAGGAGVQPVGADWANVTDPGAYVLAAIGMYVRETAAGGTATASGAVVGRYIK